MRKTNQQCSPMKTTDRNRAGGGDIVFLAKAHMRLYGRLMAAICWRCIPDILKLPHVCIPTPKTVDEGFSESDHERCRWR